MTLNPLAVGQTVNLTTEFNKKVELPIIQSDMVLDVAASATGQAVRYDEFSQKHNNDGTFKTGAINQADINLTSSATATGKPVRRDEFSARHNDTGTVKQMMFNKSGTANPSATVNTPGTATTNTPVANYTALATLGVNLVFGGTFGGSETVTVTKTVTYSDSTTATLTKTATATGTTTLSTTDFLALVKDGLYITQSSWTSQSNIASSAVTVTVNRYGFYM